MVALLGPVRLRLDEPEQRAIGVLVECGLVSAQEAHDAYAVPDLPDWVIDSWVTESGVMQSEVTQSEVIEQLATEPHDPRPGRLRGVHGRATG